MGKKVNLTLAVLVIICLIPFSSFAQSRANKSAQQVTPEQRSPFVTFTNLEIDTEAGRRNLRFLRAYIQCRAVSENNQSLCTLLDSGSDAFEKSPGGGPERVRDCNWDINKYHGFFGSLALLGSVDLPTLTACRAFTHSDIGACKAYAQTIASGAEDTSICNKAPEATAKLECVAVITGQDQQCRGNQDCLDTANYYRALKENNISTCARIKNKNRRYMCRAEFGASCENSNLLAEYRDALQQTKRKLKTK